MEYYEVLVCKTPEELKPAINELALEDYEVRGFHHSPGTYIVIMGRHCESKNVFRRIQAVNEKGYSMDL